MIKELHLLVIYLKIQDIKVLDLQGLSNIADCFVIASGKNSLICVSARTEISMDTPITAISRRDQSHSFACDFRFCG